MRIYHRDETASGVLTGELLRQKLTVLPAYDPCLCRADASLRLEALNDIYEVFVPTQMAMEIYTRMELAVRASLKKKSGKQAIRQRYANHRLITGRSYRGIVGGSDSFTIIGTAGIGKSASIGRAISLIEETASSADDPIITCLQVQCPFDCSSRGLLLSILRSVDGFLGSKYYETALRARATIDMLIGSVATVAMNCIGMIVVDEAQNVIGHRNGLGLIGMLTQLINASGVSICMVGVPSILSFFEQEMHLARRSIGLQYEPLEYGKDFIHVCQTMMKYQYVADGISADQREQIIPWLYEHSGGVLGIVVSLIHDAQEIAILSGEEQLSLGTLNKAFKQRSGLIHGYIHGGNNLPATSKIKPLRETVSDKISQHPAAALDDAAQQLAVTIQAVSARGRTDDTADIVGMLRPYVTVEDVCIS